MVEKLGKAVIFDMDGVLINSEWLVQDCWKQVAAKYGLKDVEEVCCRSLGTNQQVSKQIFLEHYGEEFPYEDYKKEGAALFYARAENNELLLKEGVVLLLEYLKKRGLRIGLATSTRQEVALHHLKTLGVLHYFDETVCGDMIKKSKPEPDIYLMACEKLGVKPEEAWAIEDSYNGIRSAFRAGMHPIMVPDLAGPTPEMEELSTCILPSLNAVKEWIEETCPSV